MNQHLQTALSFIQQAKGLSAEEKNTISNAVAEAGEELEIATRELEMEASLERVRAKAIAMHSSEDLSAAVNVFFKELKALGVVPIRCGVGQVDDETHTTNLTVTTSSEQGESFQVVGKLKQEGHPVLEAIYDNWKLQKEYHPVLRGDDIKAYYTVTKNQIAFPEYDENITQYGNIFYFKEGFVFAWTAKELSEDEMKIFRRFTSVLSLTYRRYSDLREAEAQAREAKIEAALERVRSRTMAMQHSDELPDTVHILFRQFMELGEAPDQMNIGIVNEEEGVFEISATDPNSVGSKFSQIIKMPFAEPTLSKPLYEAWKTQKKSASFDLHGQELVDYIQFRSKLRGVPPIPEQMQGHRIINVAFFSKGCVSISTLDPRPASTVALLERFVGVFDLTYTRFLDLKQAEAQAREARIESALERVRARTLAMQAPEELSEVVEAMSQEIGMLGLVELGTTNIYIYEDNSNRTECWFPQTEVNGKETLYPNHINIDLTQTWVGREILKYFQSNALRISITQTGQNRYEWVDYCCSISQKMKDLFEGQIQDRIYHLYKFSNGAVAATSLSNISAESWELLKRIASVFSLAYSRFKDLTKAREDLLQLKEEKKRSDSLLLNILPEEIANELKQFGKSYARSHEQVTILFADIKGFSTIAENMSPQELVTQLDECFRAFDHIVEKHGLEKIKTIGDAYMCVCGLPKPVFDNAYKTIRAAIDMLEYIKGFGISKRIQDLPVFEFRIGIHTGPVVTGVVGLKKFTYDIWGDTVNMAARMEQHGETNRINISGSTYQLVKDRFTLTHRGKVPAKNMGEVDMYFVE